MTFQINPAQTVPSFVDGDFVLCDRSVFFEFSDYF
jgi:glutathione S-transferase